MLIKGENKKGCCLEPLRLSEEDSSETDDEMVNCLIAHFLKILSL